jgi:hypothetical protein
MNKQHFDQLVKGVRAMKRHAAGLPVRGARVTELAALDARHSRSCTDQRAAVRAADACAPAHPAKLESATNSLDWASAGIAEDRRVETEVSE